MGGDNGPDVDAIRLSPADNVATVLRAVAAGEHLRVRCGTKIMDVRACEPIPLCHKISLAEIGSASPVIKYGQPIGEASAPIPLGAHVHVHNMRSARAKLASLPHTGRRSGA